MRQTEQAEFTNMCMVYDGKGNILVQQRTNPNWPGITFPGGHVEKNEPFLHSAIREVKEETGLDIENLKLCGVKQFEPEPGVRYVVFYIKTNCYRGELQSSEEGNVFWVALEQLREYRLARSFAEMLPVFLEDQYSEFYYEKDGSMIVI